MTNGTSFGYSLVITSFIIRRGVPPVYAQPGSKCNESNSTFRPDASRKRKIGLRIPPVTRWNTKLSSDRSMLLDDAWFGCEHLILLRGAT
jgi:hypothetical protein